jgi:ureidoglycolate dehydrogenase (NAD+)
LRTFATEILDAGGFAIGAALQTADLLVWAEARGASSHGVLRIPRYIEMVRLGLINGTAQPRFVSGLGASAVSVLEGANAPGAIGMIMAMKRAIEHAATFGIGWCSVRDISHPGAVGYFAEEATRAGHIGIAMTASKPLMSYFGAKGVGVSTNPIAIAAPNAEGRHPILLDMSTSAAALGKIMAARDAGAPIPLGWGVDASGADTTDPNAVKVLLPMAGAKGSGLSLMIEVLSSVLVGNALIASALAGNAKGAFNGLAIAIKVEAFGDPAAFRDGIAELGAAIKALPRADGVAQIFLPGERGYARAAQAEADGIALHATTAAKLVKLAEDFKLSIPKPLR